MARGFPREGYNPVHPDGDGQELKWVGDMTVFW